MRNGDNDILVRNQVFQRNLDFFVDNLRPALVAKRLLHFLQFFYNHTLQNFLAGKYLLEARDEFQGLFVFGGNLLSLKSSQSLQPHIENCLRLHLAELKLVDQAEFGRGRLLGGPDKRDDSVQNIQRAFESFEDVRARFGLFQVENGPAAHNFSAMFDEAVQDLRQAQNLGLVIDDGQENDAE